MNHHDTKAIGGLHRSVEWLLALTLLIVAFPLLALAALLVACSSKGPILFRQERVGRSGRSFTLIKFRTMRSSPRSTGPGYTAQDDPRITLIGKILRRSKLDELPELINILRGDMSWVGPRPEVPRYVDIEDRRWCEVLRVRPGLTDPVTLRLRNEEELLAAVDGDRDAFYLSRMVPFKLNGYLDYQLRRSWWSDVAVLVQTALAIVVPQSIEGPSLAELSTGPEEAR